MNEQLKFSWGHIIAFLALIFVSYMTFMGVTYKTDGNFLMGAIGMIVVDVVLLLVFIGAQMAKATNRKFKRTINIERALLVASPVVFIACMVPFSHFWTVRSHNDEIVKQFTSAVSSSKQFFDDYDNYASKRIQAYDAMLGRVVASKNASLMTSCGITAGKERIQRANMVHTLELQLTPPSYAKLKQDAIKWIDNSSTGASTWNVFLMGNTHEIKDAIYNWDKQLATMAQGKLSNEELAGNTVPTYEKSGQSKAMIEKQFNSVKALYTTSEAPAIVMILISIVLYGALLFPYLLQDRHTKSPYRLLGEKDETNAALNFTEGEYITPMDQTGSSQSSAQGSDDEYGSFTL